MNTRAMTPKVSRRRGVALALYLAVAVGLAAIVTGLGMLPADSIGTSIRLQALGGLAVVHVADYLLAPFAESLPNAHLPEWTGIAMFGLVAALYALLVALPSYFYFRTRLAWIWAIQAFTLAAHVAFAQLVVAPFWISM